MPSINKLSDRKVRSLSKRGHYADGGNLYLQVSISGTKSWIFRYKKNNKTFRMGLGATHTTSLAEARELAVECRKLIRDGIDPIEQRKFAKTAKGLETAKSRTFKECAEAYISAHSAGWKNIKHANQWTNTLKTYVYPIFGHLNVADIDKGLVLQVLEPIWTKKTETAKRLRGRIESILDWATVKEFRAGENPARWKGNLEVLLPMPSKVQAVVHHPSLPYKDVGGFMEILRQKGDVSAHCLEFIILTACRTNEAIGATWAEVDFDNAIWTIPSKRMKSLKEHRVPLSKATLNVLQNMLEIKQSEFVFAGGKRNKPLSNMACLQLLKRMGRSDVTVHGFRSTFRDWASEHTNYSNEVSEMALAHAVSDKVEAAYRRGDLFDKRKQQMNDWAEFCDRIYEKRSDNVVPIKAGR
jgi:integrase